MAKVARYLPAAVEDLHSIWSYAADSSQSEDVADRLIAAIDERIHFYAQNAEIGTPRFELGRDLRCFTVASFVVFYLSTAAGIEVIQIIHGARDIPTHFRRPSQ